MSTAIAFFFGGYNATQIQVDSWVRNAHVQQPTIDFIGFPWPVLNVNSSARAKKEIKKSNEYKAMLDAIAAASAPKFYIVGHSSGCAIANDAVEQLQDKSKVTLVSLDGFKPDPELRKLVTNQVWAAAFGKEATSFNHPGLGYPDLDVYQASVKSYWALHFSLVNTKTTDGQPATKTTKAVPATSIETGYDNCEANLCWL